jgi:cytochrome c oxidase cbb3-type subunit 1
MTTAPNVRPASASAAAASAEISDIDLVARGSLSLQIISGLLWLVISGAFALVNLIQAQMPAFLAECPVFTYGRTHAMAETAFIYGWAANAGFAVALWLLGRLGGNPLRSLNWVTIGTIFWNLAVLGGVIGIAFGEGTSITFLQMPRAVQPLLLVAFGAIAIPGLIAWIGRRQQATFASQWYVIAAFFLFPWLFSAAQVALLWTPVRGVLQAITAGWFVQGAWTLWLAPLALAPAYYLVPKITGRLIPNYDFAPVSFWTLVVIGGWTGGRHLVGGPVPAWIASVAVVSSVLLLFHYLVVALNLRGAFSKPSVALKFVGLGLIAYVLGGILDAVTAFRSVAVTTQFTWFTQAQTQLAWYGAFSMMIFGAIYFLTPRLVNQAWPSSPLLRAHFAASVIGTVTLVGALAVAGLTQGRDLADPKISFVEIAADTRVWLEVAAAGQALLLIGNAVLAFHFIRLTIAKVFAPAVPAAALFRQPPSMEASAT